MEDDREELVSGKLHRGKKRRQSRLRMWTALFFVAIGAWAFFFYQVIFRVEPAFTSATYELGDSVSGDVENYLLGTEWSVGLGELDISQVNQDRIGSYRASVRHGRKEFFYEIIIRDTIPPALTLKQEPIYLAAGREYSPPDNPRGQHRRCNDLRKGI